MQVKLYTLNTKYSYDPSTSIAMSRTPTTRDPYEQQTVYVGQSRIHPEAGEGLFAKRPLSTGALVALFNGVRQREITGRHYEYAPETLKM